MRKKVIQVLNHFLPDKIAGTEVYVWALAKQLQQTNFHTEILIPNYNSHQSLAYQYDGLKVTCFAEPSVVDRSLIMGMRKPDGLKAFIAYLLQEKPDIVHFHQLAGSNGISVKHIIAAKETGAKIIVTFHLSISTCIAGNLLYKEKFVCDGKVKVSKCSACYLHLRVKAPWSNLIHPFAMAFQGLGINTTLWNNPAGTALGTGFIISNFQRDFNTIIQQCDKVVVLTNWYKKVLLLNGVQVDKIAHVPQGLPSAANGKFNVDKPLFTKRIRLIFIGRISYFKGVHLLLQAILSLPNDLFELEIYGQSDDGVYEREWRAKTKLAQHIQWKGKLEQQDVLPTMEQFDALCLCSTTSEMSPLVIQEALAAGIPTIASNVAGNAEQIQHDYNGLLFRFKDAAALQEQLVRCVEDPSLLPRLKTNIKPPRSFAEVASDYVELYKKILS